MVQTSGTPLFEKSQFSIHGVGARILISPNIAFISLFDSVFALSDGSVLGEDDTQYKVCSVCDSSNSAHFHIRV